MKKCPKCKKTYGYRGGKPGTYVYCPLCGERLEAVKPRRVYLTRDEWEEFNRAEHAIPWNADLKMKGLEDESF